MRVSTALLHRFVEADTAFQRHRRAQKRLQKASDRYEAAIDEDEAAFCDWQDKTGAAEGAVEFLPKQTKIELRHHVRKHMDVLSLPRARRDVSGSIRKNRHIHSSTL